MAADPLKPGLPGVSAMFTNMRVMETRAMGFEDIILHSVFNQLREAASGYAHAKGFPGFSDSGLGEDRPAREGPAQGLDVFLFGRTLGATRATGDPCPREGASPAAFRGFCSLSPLGFFSL